MTLEQLKYPIGPYTRPESIEADKIENWIDSIEKLPQNLRSLTKDLSEEQMSLCYRPGSWQIKQVIHHIADSHINSYCRFKLALTEDNPSIKPYDENLWSELIDAKTGDPAKSIDLLSGLHYRWSMLLKALDASELKKNFYHAEHDKLFPLDEMIAHYAWHSDHHFAQIEQAIRLNGQFD